MPLFDREVSGGHDTNRFLINWSPGFQNLINLNIHCFIIQQGILIWCIKKSGRKKIDTILISKQFISVCSYFYHSWLPYSTYLYFDFHLLCSMTKLKEHSREICKVMSPYCWTSHGCSALFVSVCLIVCVFLYVTCFPNCMSLCASPASLCVSWANSLSLYFESMRLLALLCVCLFVFVSLCVCVSSCLCLFVGMCVHFLPPPPLLKCTWCLCVCPCVFVFMFLCVCVYIFAYMLFPPCGGGAHGRTGQGCGKVWGGDLSH